MSQLLAFQKHVMSCSPGHFLVKCGFFFFFCGKLFKGLRPPAADPQQNEGMMLRGYENHEAIALVTCAS